MNLTVYKGRVWSHWSTAQSTTSSGYRQLSLLETAVFVSAGSFHWLLLPIWPQPHRPSDYSLLSSRERKHPWTSPLRLCWRHGAIPCLGRRHLNPPNRAYGTGLWWSWTRPRFAGRPRVSLTVPGWTQRAALIQRIGFRPFQ